MPERKTSAAQANAAAHTKLHEENTDLAKEVELLKSRVLTDEELAFVRNAKLERERSAWAWQQLRMYAPWVVAITSAVSSAIYWVVTHLSFKNTGP